jgi:hypothetical protein
MQYSKLGFGQAGRVFASWRGVSPAGNQTMQVAAGRQWMGTGQRWGVHALLVAFGCACFLLALYRHEHEAAITKTPMGNTDSLLIIITVSRPLQNRRGKKIILYFKHSSSLYDAPVSLLVSITKAGRPGPPSWCMILVHCLCHANAVLLI